MSVNGISENPAGMNLTKTGSGTLTIDAASSYSGTTTVSAGTLKVNPGTSISTGPLVVNAADTVTSNVNFLESQTVTAFRALAGSGSATVSVAANKTLTVNQSGPTTYQGSVNVTGTLAKNGAGSLEIQGPPTLANNSQLSVGDNGTLKLNVASAQAANVSVGTTVTATVASGATLELAGSVSALADPTALIASGTDSSPTQRAEVQNSGTVQVDNGATQQVGGIDGSGSVIVSDTTGATPTSLTADHINQTLLVIGAGSVFTLAPLQARRQAARLARPARFRRTLQSCRL